MNKASSLFGVGEEGLGLAPIAGPHSLSSLQLPWLHGPVIPWVRTESFWQSRIRLRLSPGNPFVKRPELAQLFL
jgi:hypothetical protein